LLAVCAYITVFVSLKHSAPSEAKMTRNLFQGARGESGQWVERLNRGEYTLTCESSEGDENALKLIGVVAKYVESRENPPTHDPTQRTLIWRATAPTAIHEANGGADTLDGPLFIEVKDSNGALLGSGKTDRVGPALRRENDVWIGLAPLRWTQLEESGKGEYLLPAGWRKEADDRFLVAQGPVIWNSAGSDIIRSITSESLNATSLTAGILNNAQATLTGEGTMGGGQIWAERVEVAGATLRFLAPLKFEHQRGWKGTAAEGLALRPDSPDLSGSLNSRGALELKDFQAHGILDAVNSKGNVSALNIREIKANGAKWTSAGLQMEGNVQWNLDLNEKGGRTTSYLLRAPRAFYRSGPGNELPKDMPADSIRSEGNPVLTWNDNTLNSSAMTYLVDEHSWHLESPVHGTVPGGSFSTKSASGSASQWIFNGPIRADYKNWGSLRGDRLVWDESPEPVYTFTGKPAVLIGLERRLSGEKIIRKNNQLQFPQGIQGSLNMQGETLTLRADRADIIGGDNMGSSVSGISIKEARLAGRVECLTENYRFSAQEAIITFDNNQPSKIIAKGKTSLQGSLGSGVGEYLELTFEKGKKQPHINWSGQVRGKFEAPFDK
jgi:hypothetical protein